MPEVTRYERMGTGYIAYDAAGKAVGLITNVRSMITANRKPNR